MKKVLLTLTHFLRWWYYQAWIDYKRFAGNLLLLLDSKLALRLTLRMFFVPLFHDASILGRILSFIYRFVRIILSSLVLIVVVVSLGLWWIAWLAAPLAIIGQLKTVGVILLSILWIVDTYLQTVRPQKVGQKEPISWKQIHSCLSKDLKRVVSKSKLDLNQLQKELLLDSEVQTFLSRLEISWQSFSELTRYYLFNEVMFQAYREAQHHKDDQVNKLHVVMALLHLRDWRHELAKKTYAWLANIAYWNKTPFIWEKEYASRPMGGINRDLTGIPTPTLDKFSDDLTKLASVNAVPEIFGKKGYLDQVAKILSKDNQNNVLITGEPGRGKTTLVNGMAQEIVRGLNYESLRFKRLIKLDISKLAAGASSAELNKRVVTIIDEIKATSNIIIFVDEIHNLANLNQDSSETSAVFNALEPHLSGGEIQFIGATTTENYKKYIEPNESFARLFERVNMAVAEESEVIKTLEYMAYRLELKNNLKITHPAIDRAIELANQVIKNRSLPDSAVNLLDEVVAGGEVAKEKWVNSLNVEKVASKKAKIPFTQVGNKEAKLLLELEKKLHQRVVGQDEAIKVVANALRRARTRLKNNHKPIASFLFAGPTGVGKTETAKTLAEEFFDSESQMIRLDMSEYQGNDSLERLIGSAPGKERASAGGQLTESVRHQPYSLLLLDELEKADANILNLFLQVLDEARLTDSQGKAVDFSNTIIIATTNVGTKNLTKDKSKALEEIESHYLPEFLNRFTGIVVFKNLNPEETRQVVKLKLEKLSQSLSKQEILIEFDDKIVDYLAKKGFSEKWGGRQIDRVIQETVMNVLAKKILKKEVVKKQREVFGLKDLEPNE